ncbi:MAG: PD-(D/E)XK nuclease family protein [Streptomycetaceae bacterium]|nr:MAG: PD-(D/E)XK nuclease family protein [Streptomycetaceae bacterium]
MSKVRLSPSRISDFNNCPQLYKYRAIDQLPEKISVDAERGTLVHSILHDLFDSPALERTLHKTLEILPDIWEKQLAEKPELRTLISDEKEWSDRVASLLSTYFLLEEPETFEATSREIHVEMDLRDDVYLHGYVDRLDVAPTGEVRIVDYKTGKAPKPGWEEKALFQLRIYALIYWRTQGVMPKLLQLLYLGDGKVLKNTPTEADLIGAEKSLMVIADQILLALTTDEWKPKPSRLCDWCSFKEICPAFTT